ncbi:MAG: polysaccharide deacetylase family protein, partial [Gemmatimonadaceae bacterium]|nr:polysaccharide deacetylase family protein [Chitinophagaceae bacterium]
NTTQKKIAISFDDGPAMSFTPEILEILREKNVAATFFCIGKRIAGNDQMLSDIHAQGHLIGNHSFSHHFWFDLFSTKKMLADVNSMNHEVDRVIGLKPRLFRPPYGVTTPNMRNVMKRGGYQAIGWNIRSLDTVIKDPVRLRKKIEGMIQPGAVILLHDTSAATTEMLAALIDNIRAKGYEFERIDKLLNIEAYA